MTGIPNGLMGSLHLWWSTDTTDHRTLQRGSYSPTLTCSRKFLASYSSSSVRNFPESPPKTTLSLLGKSSDVFGNTARDFKNCDGELAVILQVMEPLRILGDSQKGNTTDCEFLNLWFGAYEGGR